MRIALSIPPPSAFRLGLDINSARLLEIFFLAPPRLEPRVVGERRRCVLVAPAAAVAVAMVGIGGVALVPDVGHEAVIVVGMVCDGLRAAVGQSHAVLALHVARLVLRLLLIKVSAGVAVLDAVSVVEGPRGKLVGVVVTAVLGNRGHRRCGHRCQQDGELKKGER